VFQIHHDIGAAGLLGLKTQSPSTLRWRLRVEVRKTCRFDKTIEIRYIIRPHGQSPLPKGSLLTRLASSEQSRGALSPQKARPICGVALTDEHELVPTDRIVSPLTEHLR
jgi:hypothetical protein